MKIFFSILLLSLVITSCLSLKRNTGPSSFEESIDNYLTIETLKTMSIPFVYSDIENIRIKASKIEYSNSIKGILSELKDSAYKTELLNLEKELNVSFLGQDSISLDQIELEVSNYPLINLIKEGNVCVIERESNLVHISILKKDYTRKMYYEKEQKLIIQKGELYTTNNGLELVKIALKSNEESY